VTWGTVIPAIITAGVAFLGVGYGARLSKTRETIGWTREQRLKAYTELLSAVENCYEAFTLIAASLNLADYNEGSRTDPKIMDTVSEWGKWDREIDRCLPQAELICSRKLQPYMTYIRMGMRSRHRILLMALSYNQQISRGEWESVSSMTHGDILKIRWRLREDITYVDPVPNPLSPARRWRVMRSHVLHTKRRRDSEPLS
jgi:hypothetical protein